MYKHQLLHPCHDEYRTVRNFYSNLIKEQRRNHWISWLEKIGDRDLWTANRFITGPPSDGGKMCVPALRSTDKQGNQIEVCNNTDKSKSKLLHKVFFFDPPNDPGIDPGHVYPEEKFVMDSITNSQIVRAISRLWPYKAPSSSEISNSILINCAELIIPYVGPIFRVTFDLKHYPEQWKRYVTIAIRKPGKLTTPSPMHIDQSPSLT